MNHSEYSAKNQYITRGDLYYADLSPVVGSEQGGLRPVLIVQNNTGNRHSPTVIVAAITSRTTKAKIPTHVAISKEDGSLRCDSTILLEQVRTIDRSRLKEYIGRLPDRQMREADTALLISLGLTEAVNTHAEHGQTPRESLSHKETAVIFHAPGMVHTAASSGHQFA